ncbi:uncharacterized protein LOC114531894 [Dendronephthya gigantea]|uniref:uncharacterized protein LOC114531894 n=1 Tax=Dendronephthya gigantea TaxID=151771 RepID=UPI00106B7C2E|nr:uncharacterized protein LOC114531894 [Dendronephthya gigantea]
MSAARKLSKAVFSRYFFDQSVKWYNELGSVMTVTSLDTVKGSFKGKYISAVGKAKKEYDLVGRFDTNGDTLGWVVSYQNRHLNAHSTCAWSGHMQEHSNKPLILTTWLLTRETPIEEDWGSTMVGFDTFTQDPPSKEIIERAKLRVVRAAIRTIKV